MDSWFFQGYEHSEMQTALFEIWTGFADSIFWDDN